MHRASKKKDRVLRSLNRGNEYSPAGKNQKGINRRCVGSRSGKIFIKQFALFWGGERGHLYAAKKGRCAATGGKERGQGRGKEGRWCLRGRGMSFVPSCCWGGGKKERLRGVLKRGERIILRKRRKGVQRKRRKKKESTMTCAQETGKGREKEENIQSNQQALNFRPSTRRKKKMMLMFAEGKEISTFSFAGMGTTKKKEKRGGRKKRRGIPHSAKGKARWSSVLGR